MSEQDCVMCELEFAVNADGEQLHRVMSEMDRDHPSWRPMVERLAYMVETWEMIRGRRRGQRA